ncbi:unnamed protein product [Rotaria sp. Silwood1]|nr:unnamed protein product [Rotaria sp. Silwood1]CAF1627752.1 unnamed protein product [Rotaria sp. Silwood1]CAF3790806.1 unnamed protein product [Rotaria sp. Silwood1]CAF3849029.1 unnamed protein product [Rotaria sp. Silwood1]CAF4820426.1 unnamed protein product [Rotaria sp. Silwood1]
MFVSLNNSQHSVYWLDCIGIHPQTKLRSTYEISLQSANLMTCLHAMNECLQGQFYVITTNHVTSSYLASKNVIYATLQTLIENNIFCLSSLPIHKEFVYVYIRAMDTSNSNYYCTASKRNAIRW